MSDVVAELDIWLNKDPWRGVLVRTTVQQARDEIVALRQIIAGDYRAAPIGEDVLEALRRSVAAGTYVMPIDQQRRIIDEILALRALVEQPLQHTTAWAEEISAQARAEALEEAAQEAAALGCKTCAHAIRALKDKS